MHFCFRLCLQKMCESHMEDLSDFVINGGFLRYGYCDDNLAINCAALVLYSHVDVTKLC